MSEITKCQSCKGDFDSQDKTPKLLPCEHSVCNECANYQYKKNRLIKCELESCQKVHQILPCQLQEDNKISKNLEQKMLQEIISKLKKQQDNLTKAQKQLSGQQSNIIYKLIKHLNDYVLKDNIALQKEIKQMNKNIKLQLNQYQQKQQNMNQNVKSQNIMQQSSMSTQTQIESNSLIDKSQKVIARLSKLTINVYEELQKQKEQINQSNKENQILKKKITEDNKQIQKLKNKMQKSTNIIQTSSKTSSSFTEDQKAQIQKEIEEEPALNIVNMINQGTREPEVVNMINYGKQKLKPLNIGTEDEKEEPEEVKIQEEEQPVNKEEHKF